MNDRYAIIPVSLLGPSFDKKLPFLLGYFSASRPFGRESFVTHLYDMITWCGYKMDFHKGGMTDQFWDMLDVVAKLHENPDAKLQREDPYISYPQSIFRKSPSQHFIITVPDGSFLANQRESRLADRYARFTFQEQALIKQAKVDSKPDTLASVFLLLKASIESNKKPYCCISQHTIAKRLGYASSDVVARATKNLCELGLLFQQDNGWAFMAEENELYRLPNAYALSKEDLRGARVGTYSLIRRYRTKKPNTVLSGADCGLIYENTCSGVSETA